MKPPGKTPPITVFAVIATLWLGGVAVLLGANATASAALFSPQAKASDSLTLSSKDRETALNDLSQVAVSSAPSTFQPSTSSALPSTVRVHAVPNKTASDVPALKPYDFAKVQGKLLIVNPHDMMIAEVIGQ